MRDVQAFGRYVLYTVLLIGLGAGTQDNPPLFLTLLGLLVLGAPAYWFWGRHVHRREHGANPKPTCSHCRVRLNRQRTDAEVEYMAQMNRKYSD